MTRSISIIVLAAGLASGRAEESAIPAPVTAARYADLLERPPFRRYLSLSEALVLSGVARLPQGAVVTIWNRSTGESFMVTATPNPQGWKLVELSPSTDLKTVTATIAAGDQQVTLRFDPDRLTPPKLDNQSKPARRGESGLVIEALLRTLDPVGAKAFEGLSPEEQEKFRKSFGEYLSTYPSSSDAKRVAYIQRTLFEAVAPPKEEPAAAPPATAPATPAARAEKPANAPESVPPSTPAPTTPAPPEPTPQN